MSNTSNGAAAGGTTADLLNGYINRIENLEEQKKEIADDIKDVYNEADGEGFDKKALKIVIRNRKIDRAEREQLEGVVETYETALGV